MSSYGEHLAPQAAALRDQVFELAASYARAIEEQARGVGATPAQMISAEWAKGVEEDLAAAVSNSNPAALSDALRAIAAWRDGMDKAADVFGRLVKAQIGRRRA